MYIFYAEESKNEEAVPDPAMIQDSTVGTAQAVLGANSTVSGEILDLDKLRFDDPLPVDEFFSHP